MNNISGNIEAVFFKLDTRNVYHKRKKKRHLLCCCHDNNSAAGPVLIETTIEMQCSAKPRTIQFSTTTVTKVTGFHGFNDGRP